MPYLPMPDSLPRSIASMLLDPPVQITDIETNRAAVAYSRELAFRNHVPDRHRCVAQIFRGVVYDQQPPVGALLLQDVPLEPARDALGDRVNELFCEAHCMCFLGKSGMPDSMDHNESPRRAWQMKGFTRAVEAPASRKLTKRHFNRSGACWARGWLI